MISSVRGTVLAAIGSTVVIEVGGIGLAISVTPQLALSLHIGSEAMLHTALIVREDDLTLFGFTDRLELTVFDLLRGVTGVGPKSALGVLSELQPGEIAHAVNTENDGAFRKVSGIGPKTAKLIVLSLAGKVQGIAAATPSAQHPTSTISASVIVALIGLGWSERVAAQAVDDAMADATAAELSAVPALLRVALTRLGPRGSSS